MIENARLRVYRAGAPASGRHVLYWMQQAQRTRYNHALEWAASSAQACGVPLRVAFALTDAFPEARARHYAFMLEGLVDVAAALHKRGISFTVCQGHPPDVISGLASEAVLLVGDIGYLRVQKQWREAVAERIRCPFTAVETDVIVPVSQASGKAEYAARTLRPKINRLLERYLVRVNTARAGIPSVRSGRRESPPDIPGLKDLRLDHSVAPSAFYKGGQQAAAATLKRFISEQLPAYHSGRNDPANAICSDMSPYLHFGQISPIDIALQIRSADAPDEAKDAYLEELIIRRELSVNFVQYQPAYDTYEALPDWARRTLDKHRHDPREAIYRREQLEHGLTHDTYWNAAQMEMTLTGKMHNYMRMYWGKKVIAWSTTPEEAFETLLTLNNKYEIDGRDANGFTGVAWCFGLHDRPWTERPVFGTVRTMVAGGLERKFNIAAYVTRINHLRQAL